MRSEEGPAGPPPSGPSAYSNAGEGGGSCAISAPAASNRVPATTKPAQVLRFIVFLLFSTALPKLVAQKIDISIAATALPWEVRPRPQADPLESSRSRALHSPPGLARPAHRAASELVPSRNRPFPAAGCPAAAKTPRTPCPRRVL